MYDERSHPSVARRNLRDVLGTIVLKGPLSRTEISRHTGLHAASVSRITKSLIAADLVRERSEISTPGKPGRRFIELEVKPDGGYVIGIAINALEQSVTLANIRNERIDRVDLRSEDVSDWSAVIDSIVSCTLEMAERNGVSQARMFGASVAVTGVINTDSGAVIAAPPLGWKDVPLREKLAEGLQMDVTVENLPNAINLAEHRFGISADFSSTLLMNTALGVGSSLLLNGQLHKGLHRSGMLAGEVLISGDDGRPPRPLNLATGGRGVLVESGMSVDEAQHLSAGEATRQLAALMAEAENGDQFLINALRRSGQMMGRFMALAGSVVQPEAYIISGLLGRTPAYANACADALRQQLGDDTVNVRVSMMTTQSAARWLAIGTWLIDKDLELSALGLAEAA
ncbi:MAG: ROK family transcriptional regulator [Rhodospirillales bacterium]